MLIALRCEELVEVGQVLGKPEPFGEVAGKAAGTGAFARAVDQGLGQRDADLLVRRLAHMLILPSVGPRRFPGRRTSMFGL